MSKTEKEKNILRHGDLITALPLSFASLLLCNLKPVNAQAGAGSVFEGTTVSCISALGDTPAELKSVRFSIGVPACGASDYGEDAPTFTAAYTLYNPTETEQKISLAFPYELIESCSQTSDWNNTENCRIRSGEENIPFNVRYTYKKSSAYNAAFDFSQQLLTGKKFFSPELSVVKYTYRIALPREHEDYCTVKMFLQGDTRTGIVRETWGGIDVKNGYRYLRYETKAKECEVTFYTLGGASEVAFIDCDAEGETPEATLVEREETTFARYVEAARPAWIGKDDWYAACVDFYEETEQYGTYPALEFCAEQSFVRWYLYEISVPAHEEKEHTVSVPFYPATSREANRYYVRLSSLASFPRLGEFAVEIDTPLFLSYSNMDFTKDGDSYTLRRDGYPYGDLEFFLSESKEAAPFTPNNESNSLIVAIVILAVVLAGAFTVTVVLLVKSRRVRKQSELLRRQADMCRPEEGKIDDPPFHDD